MASLVLNPLPGAGFVPRLAARVRRLLSRRLLLRLAGVETVTLEGRVCALRPVPLGVARDLVPALIRCARSFAAWEINEPLYDDFIKTLSLGLGIPPAAIERLSIPLWELAPIVDRIARINGLPTLEAGSADMGKLLALLTKSTGTNSLPGSSAAPAGPGSMSSNA